MVHECGPIVVLRAVVVKVVGFGIGDDGDLRMVFGEAAVRFVGLGHQHVALAGMAAVQNGTVFALDGTADGVARIGEFAFSGVHENVRQHGAGRGLAVGAGHGHRTFRVHQQGEDVAAVHDALPCLMRGDDFRIVRLDGAGEHDGVLAFDVLRLLAEFDGDAEALQTVGFGAWLTVRTIDLDTLLMQHFSEHAHARATDADEMRGT